MSLTNELIKGLLPEQEKRTVAVYGGGFKPPTAGHFEVVETALEENPEIDELIILIGGKEREGVTPEEAILIWDIYKQYLPMKVEIQLSSKPPIQAVYNYAKEHPEEDVLFILGAREGNEDDFSDIAKRTQSLDKYPNLELRTIITQGGASGTAARNAAKISLEKFKTFLPKQLKDEEVEEIYDMVKIVVTELGMKEKLGLRTTQSYLLKENKPQDGKAAPYGSGYDEVEEGRKKKKDPKKGTGKKPKKSGRRLYTDEDPKDTVGIKFSTRQDIVDTLNKKSFKAKSHARQSQIINLIHQRVRAALGRTKDPAKKKKLKSGFEYIKKRKEASKAKTQRLKKLKESKLDVFQGSADNITSTEHPRRWDKNYNSYSAAVQFMINVYYERAPKKSNKPLDRIFTGEPYVEGDSYPTSYFHLMEKEDYEKFIEQADDILVSEPGYSSEMKFEDFADAHGHYIDKRDFELFMKSASPETITSRDKDEFKKRLKLKESKPFKREGTEFRIGQVLTYRGYKEQRDFPVEVVDVKWNEERNEYEYSLMLLRDLSSQRKRGLKMKFLSAEEIKRRLADKQLTRAEFERQATRRKDSFDKPITYKSVGHFQEGDTYEKMAAKGKKAGNLKQGTVRKRLNIPKGEKIPLTRIKKEISRIKKMENPSEKNKKYLKALNLAKTLKTTTNVSEQLLKEVLDPVNFDFRPLIMSLTKSMEQDGLKLKPYPKVKFIHTDYANADDFFGKTAYYNPNNKEIVLYTLGRHPKDILRSYAHELVHVHQDNEDRLHNVQTTNINQDDYLEQLEREAYEEGNIKFRSWTNRITDQKDPFGLNAYALELAKLNEDENKHYIYLDMDGVVADFDKRFEDLSGMMPQEYVNKNGLNAFWDLIDEKHKVAFWRGIELMPGAEKLVRYVEQHPFEMLTAPSVKKQSVIGKSLWVKDKVGTLYSTKPKVTYRSAKQKHTVKPNLTKFDILIDDKASTIDRWNGAGGTAILYQSADQVINDLKKLGL